MAPAVPAPHPFLLPGPRGLAGRRALLAAAAAWPWRRLAAATPTAPVRVLGVGPGAAFPTLAAALAHSADGDCLELQPGVYRGDVGIVERRGLVIRGLGDGAVLDAAGRHAAGKGILVVRGDVTLENLEFRGARVPDGNGAGVRFDHGRLVVRRCRFVDNEMGLLSGNDGSSELEIEDCLFADAPRHAGLLHHLLYVGAIARLSLTGSRFENGWRGHLVKTRARHNHVAYNLLRDGIGGASYKLELANGGHNLVLGNLIVQGAGADSNTLLAFGIDADPALQHSLALVHNTLVAAPGRATVFVGVAAARLPHPVPLRVLNNLFVGPGLLPSAVPRNANVHVDAGALQAPEAGDYRWRDTCAPAPATALLPADWLPRREPVQPMGSRALPADGARCAGALQPGL